MKYLASACSHEHLLQLLETDLDGFIIGEATLSLRLPFTYTLEALVEAAHEVKAKGKELYIDLHTMITNDLIPEIERVLLALSDVAVDGYVFADPAVFMVAKDLGLELPFVLSTETTTTNWFGVEYWANKGIKHVAIAKELTKQAIRSIAKNIQHPDVMLEVQGFGPLSMFHSRRNLLNNYYDHLEQVGVETAEMTTTYLHDKERQNYYQIFEDASGTHIMAPKDICLVDELKYLFNTPRLAYVKLDALGHDEAFMNTVFETFLTARALYLADPETYATEKANFLTTIQSLYAADFRGIDKGFLNKPTIY